MTLANFEIDDINSILYLRWPNTNPIMNVYIVDIFFPIMDAIHRYNIRGLLIDSSQRDQFSSGKTYRQLLEMFGSGIIETKVQKVARLQSARLDHEIMAERQIKNIIKELNLNVEFRNFINTDEAIAWLKQ